MASSLFGRLRAVLSSWQELRELSRTAPQRLEAIAAREREQTAASAERTRNLKKALASPFEVTEAVVEQTREQSLKQMDANLGALLSQIQVDEAAVRRKALSNMAQEMESMLTAEQPDDAKPRAPAAPAKEPPR